MGAHKWLNLVAARAFPWRTLTPGLPQNRALPPAQLEERRLTGGRDLIDRRIGETYISALELRESVIAHLAIFAGMRPGEFLAVQRRHISVDCRKARIEQRLYRGDIDTPKTTKSARTVAIPPKTASLLKEWMELVRTEPDAWVFASENSSTPMWRDNVWCWHMKPRLFQMLRRTYASLAHDLGVDPKSCSRSARTWDRRGD